MRLFLLLFVTGVAASCCYAQKTTRPKLELDHQVMPILTDTVYVESGDIVLTGYEKQLLSRTESVFATNNTEYTVAGIKLTLAYYDAAGRQIHRRQWTGWCQIPPGETRVIDIKAWDKQNAWYYIHTRTSNKNGSPFDVKIKTDCIIVNK